MKVLIPIKYILIAFVIIIVSPLITKAQVIFSDSSPVLTIGRSISYYIDSSGSHTADQLSKFQFNFRPQKADVPNFGLLKQPLWVKLSITNQSNTPDLQLEFDQASFDSISFYYLQNGKYRVNQSGLSFPFQSRMIDYHKFIYDLYIPHNATAIYYVRIKSSQEIQLPVLLAAKDTIIARDMLKNILFGIFFGIIVVMFFYNLFIYFTVRDSIYLYYVIYILVVGLTQATIEGYSFQYLWPDNLFFAPRAFFFFTALVNITGLEFVRRFLNTSQFAPRITKIFYVLYLIYGTAIVLTFTGSYHIVYQILQLFAGVVSIVMLVVTIIIAKQGYRPAKFFLIAWIPLILGIIIYVLRDMNVIPYTFISNYSITIGSGIEVILLSFALADKINILKAEKEKSQQDTLNAIRENERIIREQNVLLEAMVTERTAKLHATLENLKQTQSQLVEAEKMASLGQLTAGIAHEINNPINFVTSNVSPLKRDVESIFDAINFIEEIGLSDAPIAEKQKKLADYKEELDFDYLKIEIGELLKGIYEGASRTADIVKGLRVFSRLDEDDIKLADINEGIDSSVIILNSQMNGKIELVREYGNLPLAECYPGKMNQVFLNILSNAIYAIDKRFGGSTGGKIIINTSSDSEYIYIKIKDNGIGMSDQTQKKIFDPFFTTKDVGEGTGLGMSIAYNTLKKHNGEITIASSADNGAEFTVKIPIIHDIRSNLANLPSSVA